MEFPLPPPPHASPSPPPDNADDDRVDSGAIDEPTCQSEVKLAKAYGIPSCPNDPEPALFYPPNDRSKAVGVDRMELVSELVYPGGERGRGRIEPVGELTPLPLPVDFTELLRLGVGKGRGWVGCDCGGVISGTLENASNMALSKSGDGNMLDEPPLDTDVHDAGRFSSAVFGTGNTDGGAL
ncbi:hypothetical protein B0H19DRAFT_1276835 [Mycena capillaripes]|nr:hypothetical protein B0H19DRAFT_1276835 [Mycena capillaripes]